MHKILIINGLFFLTSFWLQAQLYLDNHYSPEYLVEQVLLSGNSKIKVENVQFKGSENAISFFQSACNSIDLKEGILLTTGHFSTVASSNHIGNSGYINQYPGDVQLQRIAKGPTYDAAILEFDFYPESDSIAFNYFFGSEEYPEFVNKGVNDVFAFLITGPGIQGIQNLAFLPETKEPVTVDHVNARRNSRFYIENKLWIPSNYEYFRYNDWAGELAYTYQFDGFTTILTAKTKVEPLSRYHIKIAIADVGDAIYDSGVFLEAGSFHSYGITKWTDSFKVKLTEKLADMEDIKIIRDSNSVRILSNVNFPFDSYDIPSDYYNFLQIIGTSLLDHPTKSILIEGHTDDLGGDDYNFQLSYKRAEAIATYLISQGVSKYRINYKGYGNTRPLHTNITAEGRAMNRRVEFTFVNH